MSIKILSGILSGAFSSDSTSLISAIWHLFGGFTIRSFLIRTFLRRPLFIIAILLVCSILSGTYPGSSDRDGERYSAADGRRLLVSGVVQSREKTVKGFRLILDHLSFACEQGEASEIGRQAVNSLNQTIMPRDRLQVFLSDGSAGEETIYGVVQEDTSLWPVDSDIRDQTDLFQTVQIGDHVQLYGKCTQPEKPTNPGQFDSRRYYLARQVILKMSQPQLRGLYSPSSQEMIQQNKNLYTGQETKLLQLSDNAVYLIYLRYRNWISDLRISTQEGLASVFGSGDAAQAAAFVLGDNSGLDNSARELFRDGGLSWLVCVSSLHISLLGMMIYRLLRSRGIRFLVSSAASFAVVGSYALMTGFSISAQRAFITFSVWLGAQIFGRTRDTLSSLSAAACLILMRQPFALWDSAFVMSFVCILSLEYITPAVSRVLKPKRAAHRKICSTLALWFGSLPVVLWFFYQTTPYASMLYPILLPLMSLFLAFGILGSLGGCLYLRTGLAFFLVTGRTFAWPCRILLSVLRLVCTLEQEIPGSVLILGRPELWQLIIYYFILSCFVICVKNSKLHTRHRVYSAGLFSSLILLVSVRFHPDFRYTCLDIGQGSCNLIEHDGSVFLFDAGSSSVDNVWQYRIGSALKYYGIRRVDAVFLSHGDMDHIDGIEQLLECYHTNLAGQNAGDVTIGQILIPDLPFTDERLAPILTRASECGIPTVSVQEGACLSQGEMTFAILSPSPERITGESNEDCIVMLLTYRDLQILFTGDLEKEGEEKFVKAWKSRALFKNGEDLKHSRKILIAGHHGSKNATSKELLDMVKPDLVLISCGKNNRYGHPARIMLERLEKAKIPYRRTDLEGAIEVKN